MFLMVSRFSSAVSLIRLGGFLLGFYFFLIIPCSTELAFKKKAIVIMWPSEQRVFKAEFILQQLSKLYPNQFDFDQNALSSLAPIWSLEFFSWSTYSISLNLMYSNPYRLRKRDGKVSIYEPQRYSALVFTDCSLVKT